MKLCKECKWVRYNLVGEVCGRTERLSPVNGEADKYCFSERNSWGPCGVDGKFWEQKPKVVKPQPWWMRLFR